MITKYDVNNFLHNSFFSVISYLDNAYPVTKLMIFTHTLDGIFYLFSYEDHSFFNSLKNQQSVSVIIYKEEVKIDDICYLNLRGEANLISVNDNNLEGDKLDFNKDLDLAYNLIADKSPFISNYSDFDRHAKIVVVKFIADSMYFTNFHDIKNSIDPISLIKKNN